MIGYVYHSLRFLQTITGAHPGTGNEICNRVPAGGR